MTCKCTNREYEVCVNCGDRIEGEGGSAKHQGLKDHQIQELVNVIRDSVKPLTPVQSLRERISSAALQYLQQNNLRIDVRQ